MKHEIAVCSQLPFYDADDFEYHAYNGDRAYFVSEDFDAFLKALIADRVAEYKNLARDAIEHISNNPGQDRDYRSLCERFEKLNEEEK